VVALPKLNHSKPPTSNPATAGAVPFSVVEFSARGCDHSRRTAGITTCSNRKAAKTQKNHGAPLDQRSAVHASIVHPRTRQTGLSQFAAWSQPYAHTASANSAGHAGFAEPNTDAFSGTFATSMRSALPACCTGARNVRLPAA
jgi:hypothetical protein